MSKFCKHSVCRSSKYACVLFPGERAMGTRLLIKAFKSTAEQFPAQISQVLVSISLFSFTTPVIFYRNVSVSYFEWFQVLVLLLAGSRYRWVSVSVEIHKHLKQLNLIKRPTFTKLMEKLDPSNQW